MSPEQERFPVAPSTVHPVAVLPPAILTVVAVAPPGAMSMVEALPKALTVVGVELKRLSVVADVSKPYAFPVAGLRDNVLAVCIVAREVAVIVVAFVTMVALPALRVRGFVPPVEAMVPAPAKVIDVGVIVMVSIEVTPDNAPAAETLSPPLEVSVNVPVVLPIETLFVPVPNDTAPVPLTVNTPDDCV